MRYQAIESKIWFDDRFCSLSPIQQRLFLYFLACPHGNFLGIFVLKPAYAQADLGYKNHAEYLKDLAAICDSGMVLYDPKSCVLWVRNLLRYGSVKGWNDKHKKGAEKTLSELPKNTLIQEFANYYSDVLIGVSIPLYIPLSIGRRITEPEPEPEPEPGKGPAKNDGGMNTPSTPLQQFFELWNQEAPKELPRITLKPSNGREKACRLCLKNKPDLEWWRLLFQSMAEMPFLLGENERGWKADLDFVVKKYEKISEGSYRNKPKIDEVEAWVQRQNLRQSSET